MSSESIVICEGFHDRSFLKGWLLSVGCTDPSQDGTKPIRDPWGRPVSRGHFGFLDQLGRFLRIVPAHSDDRCFSVAEDLLKGRATHPIRDLVVVVDSDNSDVSRRASRDNLVSRLGGQVDADHTGILQDGTRVRLIILGDAPIGRGTPRLSCLERTVCSAIAQAYPLRAEMVEGWVGAIGHQHSPAESAKAHAWTYMAGWFANFGCDGFYQEIWRDPLVREPLITLLQFSGAWDAMRQTVSAAP